MNNIYVFLDPPLNSVSLNFSEKNRYATWNKIKSKPSENVQSIMINIMIECRETQWQLDRELRSRSEDNKFQQFVSERGVTLIAICMRIWKHRCGDSTNTQTMHHGLNLLRRIFRVRTPCLFICRQMWLIVQAQSLFTRLNSLNR
jgi:hypothetical protein